MGEIGADIRLSKRISMVVLLTLIALLTVGFLGNGLVRTEARFLNEDIGQAKVLAGEFGFNPEATLPEASSAGSSRRYGSDQSEEWLLFSVLCVLSVLASFSVNRKLRGAHLRLYPQFAGRNTVLHFTVPVGQHAPPVSL